MIIPDRFTYLFTTILFLVFWLVLFLFRKDLRKEMLFMSLCLAFFGLLPEYFLWTKDWWRPITITGTRVGIEDFLLGFTNGGIAAVLYEVVFKRRLYKRKHSHHNTEGVITFLVVIAVAVIYGFHFLGLSSFESTTLSLLAGSIIIVSWRKDLFRDALISGFLVAIIFLPFYWIPAYFSPGIIERTWFLKNLSGLFVLGVPWEDFVFYFLTGFTIGPMYEFWQEERLRRIAGGSSLFKFSVRNYYLLMGLFLLLPLYLAIKGHSLLPLLFMAVFALAGVLGETLFAVWWHVFFEKKFWTYRVETLAHSYTSLLNFIPWGVGGLLYLEILGFVQKHSVVLTFNKTGGVNLPFWVIFAICMLIGFLIQIVIWTSFIQHRNHHFKFKAVTLGNYLFFNFPFLLALSICSVLYGKNFLVLAAAFGIVAIITEYLFGKAVEFFISKKLWVYNYEAFDKGHFTPLSLLPFSLGGFYFWGIALIVSML